MKLTRTLATVTVVALLALTGCSKSTDAASALTFGIDTTYAPDEFTDAKGNPIGWDVDLGKAIAKQMGRTAVFKIATFDSIIPGVTGGKYDAGLSSFSDTPEREKQIDFVNYYSDGIQWANAIGTNVNPDNACGLKIAVQTGTTSADDLTAKSKNCTDNGKAPITQLKFDSQDMATQAAVTGRAAAVSADSPVIQYAVQQNSDKLELIGKPYDLVLYGIAVKKGNSAMVNSIKDALTAMLADGTYTKILDKWGVTAGAVSSITINGK